jgi:hypothetical protein
MAMLERAETVDDLIVRFARDVQRVGSGTQGSREATG